MDKFPFLNDVIVGKWYYFPFFNIHSSCLGICRALSCCHDKHHFYSLYRYFCESKWRLSKFPLFNVVIVCKGYYFPSFNSCLGNCRALLHIFRRSLLNKNWTQKRDLMGNFPTNSNSLEGFSGNSRHEELGKLAYTENNLQ